MQISVVSKQIEELYLTIIKIFWNEFIISSTLYFFYYLRGISDFSERVHTIQYGTGSK